jgi:hypothetical protein
VETAPEYERLPPERLPPGPWWASPGPAILAAIIALLVGGGVGYLIGHNANSEGAAGATHTVTNTTTAQPKTVTNTVTSTTVKETSPPANQANEERRREAEADLRKAEKENQELKRQLEQSGGTP